jgi:hypothetical protein
VAFAAGLSKDALVRTSSPVVFFSGLPRVECVEKRLDRAAILRFQRAPLEFSLRLLDAAAADPELAEFALTIARVGTTFHSRVLFKAACLNSDDFREPRVFIARDFGDATNNGRFNPPWERILQSNRALTVWRAHQELPQTKNTSHLWTSLRHRGWGAVGLRLWLNAWEALPHSLSPRRALLFGRNELMGQTALALANRGVAIRRLAAPAFKTEELPAAIDSALSRAVASVVQEHSAQWVCSDTVAPCVAAFLDDARQQISRQRAAAGALKSVLDRVCKRGSTVLLSNYPGWPEHAALARLCRDREIPFIAFQHGVAREICETHVATTAFYENAISDLLFTFNEEGAAMSRRHPFARGRVVAVGMPDSVRRAATRCQGTLTRPPIIYVSTNLYRHDIQMLLGTLTDIEKARLETNLIRNVFSQLPHRIFYKPYRSLRNMDGDPVLDEARGAGNILVYEEGLDARYLLADYRVIVTTRATSTMMWCLHSDKPLVFIDHPDDQPLRDAARRAMQDGIFLFNGAGDNFHELLRDFLSKPIDEIESLWQNKIESRRMLIEQFFSSGRGGGKRAASIILAEYL